VKIPAEAGGMLVEMDYREEVLSEGEWNKNWSGVGKLLHMMWWSRPEIYNVVSDLSRYMTTGNLQENLKAMEKVMNYSLSTRERGLLLKPDEVWEGYPEFKLRTLERLDSYSAKDMETRKSVSGTSSFFCGAPI